MPKPIKAALPPLPLKKLPIFDKTQGFLAACSTPCSTAAFPVCSAAFSAVLPATSSAAFAEPLPVNIPLILLPNLVNNPGFLVVCSTPSDAAFLTPCSTASPVTISAAGILLCGCNIFASSKTFVAAGVAVGVCT